MTPFRVHYSVQFVEDHSTYEEQLKQQEAAAKAAILAQCDCLATAGINEDAQLAPTENRSTKECGWKDGDRGGPAQNKKNSIGEEKEKPT